MEWNDLTENSLLFQEIYFKNGCKFEQCRLFLYMLIYVKRGEMHLTISGKEYVARPGEVLFVPSESLNLVYNYFGTPYHGLTLRFRSFPNVGYYEYPAQVVKISEKMQKIFEAIPCNIPLCAEKLWKFYKVLSLFQPLLQPVKQKHLDIVNTAMEYMTNHDHYSIASLAKLCYISESGFRAIFQQVTHYTVIGMKHRLQAYKAEFLLRSTDLTIDEISQKVGFASTRHFRKVFKSRYEIPPDKFRRTHTDSNIQLAPPPKNVHLKDLLDIENT